MEDDAAAAAAARKKLYIRGTITNAAPLAVLFAVSYISAGMPIYVATAIAMQWVTFAAHGWPQRSEKFYDVSGSATHFAVVVTSLVSMPRARSPRQLLTALLSTIWMTRLGTFLYVRIQRDGKDQRFDNLKKVWLSFMGAWTIQAAWVVLIQLPVLLANDVDDTLPTSAWDVLAFALWVVGFLLEFNADVQKFIFRQDPANKDKFITTGVWRYSQQPNYAGEILMWAAMALGVSAAGVAAGHYAALFAWISPAFTAFLLLKVSGVPYVNAAAEKKWGADPAYRAYVADTPKLVPWWPKQGVGAAAPASEPAGDERLLAKDAPRS